MQPTPFHIRDVSGAIQLSEKREYDDLIGEHSVATLGYVDDDDGEVITVGSSNELFDRIDELQSLRPVVFDLLTSLKSWPKNGSTAEGIRVWREFVDRKYNKGKDKELLVDVSDTTTTADVETTAKVEEEEPQPFLTAFEQELKKLLESQTPEDPPEQQVPPPPTGRADIVAQAIQSMSWASQSILRLRRDLPQRAQPAVENLGQAVYAAMGGLTMQLSQISEKAANATREIDTAEIEAIKEKIRNLAVGIGHVAAQTGAGAGDEVRKAADVARRELAKARIEIAQNVSEAVRGLSAGGLRSSTVDASSTTASAGTTASETSTTATTTTTGTKYKSPTVVEAEDDSELCDVPEGATLKPLNVTFSPPESSQYRSCAEWLKDVKEKNAKTQEAQSKEQDAVAFWQQMDRIAHYTAEQPSAAHAQEQQETVDEPEPASASSLSDDDNVRRPRWFPRPEYRGGHRGPHGRFREENGLEQHGKRRCSRRPHGPPPHPPHHRHSHRHHLRGPPPPPLPPHFSHHGDHPFPPPPPPTHNGDHSFPPPPPPTHNGDHPFPPPPHNGSHPPSRHSPDHPFPPPPPHSGEHPFPPPLHGRDHPFGHPPHDKDHPFFAPPFPYNGEHHFSPPPPPPSHMFPPFMDPLMRHRRSVNFDAPAPASQPHGLRRARTVATFHPLDRPLSPLFPTPPVPAREDPFATPPRIPSPAMEEAFEDAQEQREEQEEEHNHHHITVHREEEEEQPDEAVDRCVAMLLEMGYGDGEEVERLRVYAQMSGGDLEDALEMLEEEKRAWEGH